MAEAEHIVIDNGSGFLKMGSSKKDNIAPECVKPAIWGSIRQGCNALPGMKVKDYYIGDEAVTYKSVLDLFYPIEYGVVNDLDKMTQIWEHVYEMDLFKNPKEHNVIITEAVNTPEQNRINMAEIFFEKFDVPALHFKIQAEMSMLGTGRQDGMVLDSGDGVTHTCPVQNGIVNQFAVKSNHVAGRRMTNFLVDQLALAGHSATHYQTNADEWKDIVTDIKKKTCCVSLDIEDDRKRMANKDPDLNKDYELPNKQKISLSGCRMEAPEGMFEPKVFGGGDQGHHILLNESIKAAGIEAQAKLYGNIILSGGNTMWENYPERLKLEMDKLSPQPGMVDVVADGNRYFHVWRGAQCVANLGAFQKEWITLEMYTDDDRILFPQK